MNAHLVIPTIEMKDEFYNYIDEWKSRNDSNHPECFEYAG